MKVLRTLIATAIVLSTMLMSAAPASAGKPTEYTGILNEAGYFGDWDWQMHGMSGHLTHAGTIFDVVTNDLHVNGVMYAYCEKFIAIWHTDGKGPFHGKFFIEDSEGVLLWEGNAVSEPNIPFVWLLTGQGKGVNEGLTLKLKVTIYYPDDMTYYVSGQVVQH
jgi:hypothetical protein